MPRPRFGHNAGALVLALVIGFGLSVDRRAHGFREDEIECEETFARLLDCCDRSELEWVDCEYHQGCDSSTYPDMSPAEARCLRELTCKQIRDAEVCAQLAARNEDSAAPLVGVCP